jgi:ectoine hydroxylase-related dioxygenase (phytanoyl-CoA dioxygenase family)
MMVKSLERLTAEQSELYDRKGYIRIPCPFDAAEVSAILAEAARLEAKGQTWDEHNLRTQTRLGADGVRIFDRLDPVTDISPLYRKIALDERVAGLARDVFQGGARLLKDKMIFRRPGSSGYRVHQDFTGWQQTDAPAEALLSVAIALDHCTPQNGALQFYEGMHHEHYGEKGEPKDYFNPSSGLVRDEVVAGLEPESIELFPGDIMVFSSLTPHRSHANSSSETRRILFLTFSEASYGDMYDAFYERFHGYLRRDRTAEGLTDLYFE